MAPKIDSLNIVSNTKPLSVVSKPENNSNIEVFENKSTKANIDEVTISSANSNVDSKEKSDNMKKRLIGAGIAIGTVAVGVATALIMKKTLGNIKTVVKNPKLSYETLRSKTLQQEHIADEVFNTETMKKLFSEEFTYKGDKPNIIYCIDKITGKPVAVTVKSKITQISSRMTEENYFFYDESGKWIGQKIYNIENSPKRGMQMLPGKMWSREGSIQGIGIRANQIQIERALELGIEKINYDAAYQASLFHTKMGFLATPNLIPITSYDEALKIVDETVSSSKLHLKPRPIIVSKEGKFYLDYQNTFVIASIEEIKKQRAINPSSRAKINGGGLKLVLQGKNFDKWKELIKGKEITPNLTHITT